ncbi:sce7726 family protein [Sulfurimonas diazotrophicus]|uniref:Sce7726 family protein n=1 Tax=Sulfurimonas diazotrophicus TaxID=3131939 RepID=A0ABZ3H6I7_9BACT
MDAVNANEVLALLNAIAADEALFEEQRDNPFLPRRLTRRRKQLRDYCSGGDDEAFVHEAYAAMTPRQRRDRDHKSFLAKYRKLRPAPASNEAELREAAETFLRGRYGEGTTIIHEFTQWNLNVRPDLFALSDSETLVAVEIKSDKDNLDRLYRQLDGYSRFSNHVYVALDERFLPKYLQTFGNRFEHVGILLYGEAGLGLYKEPEPLLPDAFVAMLRAPELKHYLSMLNNRSRLPGNDYNTYRDVIDAVYTQREREQIARQLFVTRLRGGRPDNVKMVDYVDPLEKQLLFDELLKPDYWEAGRLGRAVRLPGVLELYRQLRQPTLF